MVQLSVGDRPVVGRVEADRQRATEADAGESDVDRGDVSADRTVATGDLDQPVEHGSCFGASIGPVGVVEQTVDDVDHPEPGVDGGVQVAAQCLTTGRGLGERDVALFDRPVEHVQHHRSEQGLLVREVPVQGCDTDAGPLCHCIPGRVCAHLEDQCGRSVEEAAPIPSSVGSHRRVVCGQASLGHETEYNPPLHYGLERREHTPMNQEHAARTPSIAEAIAAADSTSHVPATFESCDHVDGPFFHGTRASFGVGDLVVPGHRSNYHDGRISNHVYFAALLEPAVWAAELATAFAGSDERGHVYVVEPTGAFEDDPNVTNKKFPGNVTRSFRTRHPMLVIDEVDAWEAHAPDVLQGMLDNLARLRAQGLDVIED